MTAEENTGVFIITEISRQRSTVKSQAIPDQEPQSCIVEEVFGDQNEPDLVAILQDYLLNDGINHSINFLKNNSLKNDKKVKRQDDFWWSFFNSGKGKGKFEFFEHEEQTVANALLQFPNCALGDTKIMAFVMVLVNRNGKACRIPFWLLPENVLADPLNNVIRFGANLAIRNDLAIDYSDFCPWVMKVKGRFNKISGQGEFQIMTYHGYRRRE